MSELLRRYARESGATTQSHDDLPPNMPILDDTPPSGVFPIKEDQLIELAKRVHAAENGAKDPDLLADNFRYGLGQSRSGSMVTRLLMDGSKA